MTAADDISFSRSEAGSGGPIGIFASSSEEDARLPIARTRIYHDKFAAFSYRPYHRTGSKEIDTP
jgi:hypothetical protein